MAKTMYMLSVDYGAIKTCLLNFLGNLLLHCGGRRSASWRIDEGKEHIEPHAAKHLQRLLKILLGLPGEAHDNIRGDRNAWHPLPHILHGGKILRSVVVTVHFFQDRVASRLQGQMELTSNMSSFV